MASGIQIKPTNAPNQTFHVTARGLGRLQPFLRNVDKREFLWMIERHLSPKRIVDNYRRPYEKLIGEVAVLAFCVLDNHFHLIVHQYTTDGMERLMRRVLTAYGIHYNASHSPARRGSIFDARYAADPLRDSDHMKEMLGYTILNDPIEQLGYEFSSNAVHLGEYSPAWLSNDLTLGVFDGVTGYREYMNRTGPARVEKKLKRWGIDPKLHPYRPI